MSEITPFEEFGFEVHDGWLPICKELYKELTDKGAEVFQIKTKFGELRCYVKNDTGNTDAIIEKYANICSNTCEWCGSNKNVHTKAYKGWIRTLCSNCQEKLENNGSNR